MFNEQVQGSFREYDCVGEIMIDPIGKWINMRPYHVYEKLIDNSWVVISRQPIGQWISVNDNIKVNPVTYQVDPEGVPAYSMLDEKFKPMVESFALSLTNSTQN